METTDEGADLVLTFHAVIQMRPTPSVANEETGRIRAHIFVVRMLKRNLLYNKPTTTQQRLQ